VGKNKLHRMGAYVKEGHENTIERMEANWIHQSNIKDYWETDTSDTKDHQLIIRHDRKVMSGHTVDYTVEELKANEPHLCTVPELFDRIIQLDREKFNGHEFKRNMCFEMKRLYSDTAKQMFIDEIIRLRMALDHKVEIQALCWNDHGWGSINHFKKIFRSKEEIAAWKPMFEKSRINVLECGNHDTCCFGLPIFVTKKMPPVRPERPVDPPIIAFYEVGASYSIQTFGGFTYSGKAAFFDIEFIELEGQRRIFFSAMASIEKTKDAE